MAEKEGVDMFVALVAPSYFSAAVRAAPTNDRHVEKVSNRYDSSAIAAVMLRHSTGPHSRRIFNNVAIQNAMNKGSVNAINDMVKAEEEKRVML